MLCLQGVPDVPREPPDAKSPQAGLCSADPKKLWGRERGGLPAGSGAWTGPSRWVDETGIEARL